MRDEREVLMSYIEFLMKLDENGFHCRKEIQEAVNKLHSLIGFNEKDVLKKLEEQVESNKHVNKLIVITEKHRGIGKTTKLFELAKRYNIPIMVGSDALRDVYSEREPSVEILVADIDRLIGKEFPNGVLVDESVSLRQYADLLWLGIKIRGGLFPIDRYFIV